MTGNDELLQAYSPQGEPTDSLSKQNGKAGTLHGASHVWIWRISGGNIEILLQRRASNKTTWPDFQDISAAGHVDFGETPLVAAIRETQEELGLSLKAEDLLLLFVHRTYMVPPNHSVIENEFQWVYGYRTQKDFEPDYADGEVDSTMWLPLREFQDLIAGKMAGEIIVPHGDAYFGSLIEELTRQSNE
jgi:isopentenyldiphosphate isomerase